MRKTIDSTKVLIVVLLLRSDVFRGLPRWEFESESDLRQSVANAHLSNFVVEDGRLTVDARGNQRTL